MKKVSFILLLLLCANSLLPAQATTDTTTYYLIRHAEKDRSNSDNHDPMLTDKGLERAENWQKTLQHLSFDAVYSTNYQRTLQTAKPLAKANAVEITLYNPRAFDIKAFKAETKGKTVLIVGHSNTTPFFANMLLGEKRFESIDDTNNSNLYIITVNQDNTSGILLHID